MAAGKTAQPIGQPAQPLHRPQTAAALQLLGQLAQLVVEPLGRVAGCRRRHAEG
jgi:hypothetical protein